MHEDLGGDDEAIQGRAKSRLGLYGLLLVAVGVLAVAGMGGGAAFAIDVQHGIVVTKGCVSPTQIGQPYRCTYAVSNPNDDAHDTLTIDSLVDVVHSAGGDVSSGNVLSSVSMTVGAFAIGFNTPPTCTGPAMTGDGSAATPWVGATKCTLPFGSRINVGQFSFYTVKPLDFNLGGQSSPTRSISAGTTSATTRRRPATN